MCTESFHSREMLKCHRSLILQVILRITAVRMKQELISLQHQHNMSRRHCPAGTSAASAFPTVFTLVLIITYLNRFVF